MCQIFSSITIFLLIAAATNINCQSDNSLDNLDMDKIKAQLPPGIIPEGFNVSSLPTQENFVEVIKKKCENVSQNPETYGKVENASVVFKTCMTGLVDFEILQKEMEEAQPGGDLDTVFNKYCRKRSIAIECMENFTAAVEPCLDKEEIVHKQTFVKIFVNLLNFVCHKDGDQIALFIAEKGPECFNSKKDQITQCFNQTFGSYIPKETPTLENLPKLIMGKKECKDMRELKTCIVAELENCEESTPANLVDSLFRFIERDTDCNNYTSNTSARTQTNNGAIRDVQSTITKTLMATVFMTILAKSLL